MATNNEHPAIESAEDGIDFALRILDALDDGYEDREPVNSGELALMIEQRDAAVAAQARREALLEAKVAINALNYSQPYGVAAAMNEIDRLLTPATVVEVFRSCKTDDGYGYEKVAEIAIPDDPAALQQSREEKK